MVHLTGGQLVAILAERFERRSAAAKARTSQDDPGVRLVPLAVPGMRLVGSTLVRVMTFGPQAPRFARHVVVRKGRRRQGSNLGQPR